jgi:hypothetical protein
MRTNRSIPRLFGAAIAVTAAAALTQIGTADASTASQSTAPRTTTYHSAGFNLVTTAQDVTLLSHKVLTGGDYTASWRMYGGEVVTVAAMQGSTVTVSAPSTDGAAHSATATLKAPNLKASGASLTQLAASYAKAGKSPAQDATAVGFTSSQASAITKRAQTANTISPMTAVGGITYSGCLNVTGDAGHAFGKSCDVQKMMQESGQDWYLGDQVTGSGNDPDWIDSLSGIAAYVDYGPNNTIVSYTPNGTTSYGSCETRSFNLGWNGVGLSSSSEVCPGSLSPYGLPSNTEFGSKWSGCDTGAITEGVNSDDVVHNPPNADSGPGVNATIWWSATC